MGFRFVFINNEFQSNIAFFALFIIFIAFVLYYLNYLIFNYLYGVRVSSHVFKDTIFYEFGAFPIGTAESFGSKHILFILLFFLLFDVELCLLLLLNLFPPSWHIHKTELILISIIYISLFAEFSLDVFKWYK